MIHERGTRAETICCNTAKAFDEKLNKCLENIKEPQVYWHENTSNNFACTVIGKYSKDIPESLTEKYNLQGIYLSCKNCKRYANLEEVSAGRKQCGNSYYRFTYESAKACEWLYQQYELLGKKALIK